MTDFQWPAPPPRLSDEEWSAVESFLGRPIINRESGDHAFWEDTYANDHSLLDNFNRLAWLGDRVLNLAIADWREATVGPMKRWDGTGYQAVAQSQRVAVEVWWGWPDRMRLMLRLGNTKRGAANPKIIATYTEAVVGLVFREHGYEAAREFVWRFWLHMA